MIKSVLVGWCSICYVVYDPYPGPGTDCDGGCGDDSFNGRPRKLRKRRMWLVDDEDIEEPYFQHLEEAAALAACILDDAQDDRRRAVERGDQTLARLLASQERERVLVEALRPFVDRWMKFAGPRVEALDVLLPAEWIRQAAAALRKVGALEEEL